MKGSHLQFRVFNAKHNKLHYWGFSEGTFHGPPVSNWVALRDCAKSDRFTGAIDFKGNPIYENDILHLEYHDWAEIPLHSTHKRLVHAIWDENLYKFLCKAVDGMPGGPWTLTSKGKAVKIWAVIGNTHQDEDLITAARVTTRLKQANEIDPLD